MTRTKSSLCTLVGYDPEILAQLAPAHVGNLESLSQGWLLSSLLLAYPIGVALWMVEHSHLLALAGAMAMCLLVVNLFRLVIAGSGTAPEQPWPRDYRPSLLPPALLLGLALLMSQPAQLLSAPASVVERIQQHREALQQAHKMAQVALHEQEALVPDLQLTDCEFLVLRLKLLWQAPTTAVLWTALYLGITLSPAILTRVLWSDAVTSYEKLRYRATRRQVMAITRAGRFIAHQQLSRYPGYRSDDVRFLAGAVPPPVRQEKASRDPSPKGAAGAALATRDASREPLDGSRKVTR